MNTTSTLRRLPRMAAAAATIFLAAALSLFMPAPGASAHDGLLGSTPADGETVSQMPEEIELTFSANVAGLGSIVKIEDTEGNDWTSGEAQIVGNSMIQRTNPDAPAGDYTVLWRAVSSDAHPIEGEFTFTVTGSAEASAATEASPEAAAPTPAQSDQPASAAPSSEAASAESAGSGAETTTVIIGAVLVLGLVAGVVAYLVRKKTKTGK